MKRILLPCLLWPFVGCICAVPLHAQRFAAIGDYGYAGPAERDVANLVKSWHPDFIITLGDNNYDSGDSLTIDRNIGQYYHEYINNYKGSYGPKAFTARFFPSLGNHDMYTTNGQPYLEYFTLPGNERYYDFIEGNIHFFVVNSDEREPDGNTSTSRQAQWLQARMATSTSRWNIVYFHHAPYSSGNNGSVPLLRWPFQAWGASAVLTGHEHHYERLTVDNIPYIINGLGGRSMYPLRPEPLPESNVTYNKNYGAMLISASADTLSFQFITRGNQLIDSHVLRKPILTTLELYTATPNPVRDVTTISTSIPQDMKVQLRVLDIAGREVAELYNGLIHKGRHEFVWSRGALKAGVYLLQLIGDNQEKQVSRLVLL